MSDTNQDDSKKDLALILTRLSNLIEADNQQKMTALSRDFTQNDVDTLFENDVSDNDADESYPELTDVANLDVDSLNAKNGGAGVDEAILNTLMKALKPAIDAAANRAIERIVLDAKQPLKQQLELEIRQTLLKVLK